MITKGIVEKKHFVILSMARVTDNSIKMVATTIYLFIY